MKAKKINLKRITFIIVGLLLVTAFAVAYNNYKTNEKIKEQELVNNYITCLKENFTQRDYCGRKVSNTDYRFLDQLIKQYGYDYKQVGYDLYVIELGGEK